MKDQFAHYEIPKSCPLCASEDVVARVIIAKDMLIVRYKCRVCGASQSLPKLENLTARERTPLDHWRRRVLSRDGYKCIICGSNKNLEAHHIIPVRNSNEQKFNDNNGITLCRECHRLVHLIRKPDQDAKT